jgi:serine/threonine protein kinase
VKSKIILGIVSGVAYLHARGIVLHGLTARKVLLNEEFEPIINSTCDKTMFHWTILDVDPIYLSPDFTSGDGRYHFPHNVYDFAVTLYVLFAEPTNFDNGFRVFGSPLRVLAQVEKGARFVKKPDIPDYHWGVIERCWNQDPNERPTFQSLLDEFRARHEYILTGADESSVFEYEDRVGSVFGAPNTGKLEDSDSWD